MPNKKSKSYSLKGISSDFVKVLISLVLIFCLGIEVEAQNIQQISKNKETKKPKNVLFILCDDLRRDMLGYAGSKAQTPNADALKAVSVDFRTAITTTGLCTPSRAALLTGRLGHRTGIDDNIHLWHSRLLGMDLKQKTLIEWAHKAGYFIGYFGKWHLGVGPKERSADRFSAGGGGDFEGFGREPDFGEVENYYNFKNSEPKPKYYALLKGTYENSGPKKEANDGIAFLQEVNQTNKPFFLTVSFHAPHPPYQVQKPYDTMYDYRNISLPVSFNDSFINKPLQQRFVLWPWHNTGHMTKQDWQITIAYSWGNMSLLDRAIGELLDALKKSGNWENTLIVFTGDQGSMLGDHGLYDKMAYSYDELMRIPLLIKVPGVPAKNIDRHVSLIDINQTLVEWMGLQPDQPNSDSRSLFPLIKNGDKGWNTPDEAFYRYEWYNGSWFGVRTIRTPAYKYAWNPTGGKNELYDLKKDPHEIQNQFGKPEYAAAQKDLQIRLLDHLKKTEDPLYEKMKIVKKMN